MHQSRLWQCCLCGHNPIAHKSVAICAKCAARLIGGRPKFEHISGFIREELHWLPMQKRIEFKILMLMRNCLAGQAPVYLRELCVPVLSICLLYTSDAA